MTDRPARINIGDLASFSSMYTTEISPKKKISTVANKQKTVGVAYRAFFQSVKSFIPHAKLIEGLDDVINYDLIIFTGGEDINPRIYNEKPTYSVGVNQQRDSIESDIFRMAHYRGKKIVGLCRGHQLINAIYNGKLYQDFTTAGFDYHPGSHPLEFDSGDSIIKRFFENQTVISAHHQAVKEVSELLRATSWYRGIVESCENDKVITTQFHPEFESTSEQHVVDFFKFLIEEW